MQQSPRSNQPLESSAFVLVAPFFFHAGSMSFASLSLGIIHVLEGEPTMNFAIKLNNQVFEFVSYHHALEAALMFGASLHRIYGRQGNSPVLSQPL